MTREEHLAFCSKCSNRKMDFDKGIICQLTEEYGSFNNYCNSFAVDQNELKIQIENAHVELEEKVGTSKKRYLTKLLEEIPESNKLVFRNSKKKRTTTT